MFPDPESVAVNATSDVFVAMSSALFAGVERPTFSGAFVSILKAIAPPFAVVVEEVKPVSSSLHTLQ